MGDRFSAFCIKAPKSTGSEVGIARASKGTTNINKLVKPNLAFQVAMHRPNRRNKHSKTYALYQVFLTYDACPCFYRDSRCFVLRLPRRHVGSTTPSPRRVDRGPRNLEVRPVLRRSAGTPRGLRAEQSWTGPKPDPRSVSVVRSGGGRLGGL